MAKAHLSMDERESMRQRLSSAATEIYLDQGLEAVSFRKLADMVGLSHTLPYLYFDSKEALLARMRQDALVRFESFLRHCENEAQSPQQRLRALIVGVLAFVKRCPADYLLIFSTHQPPPDRYPDLLAARRHLFDHLVEVVGSCIDAGLMVGEARQVTHGLWVALHGLMSLHVANQLVHGYALDQLVWPIIERMSGIGLAVADSKGGARIKPRARKEATVGARRQRS